VGDHLIATRAKRLLKEHIPDVELVDLPRWVPLDEHLREVNSSDGVILCGGPAYQPHLYPGIYPLVKDLDAIHVPIIPFGLGWKGFPGDDDTVREYKFSASSLKLLERIHNDCKFTSVRDYITERILKRYGFTNVIMTGDPAWYDLDFLEKPFTLPESISTVAISMPANPMFYSQAIELAESVRETLPKGTKIFCSFHHGWEASEYVPPAFAKGQEFMKRKLIAKGFEVVSLARNIELLERLYTKADIHIGYRLHAHLFFLSRRKPSFLLEEDGRGRGASEALGLHGIPAWSRSHFNLTTTKLTANFIRFLRGKGVAIEVHERKEAIEEAIEYLREEMTNGFARFRGLHETLLAYYHNSMGKFLDSLPGITLKRNGADRGSSQCWL